jgi:hypothetical protein
MSEELNRIRRKSVDRWINFTSPDGTSMKCPKCGISVWFEVLTLTNDGYLLFRCMSCKAEIIGDMTECAGASFTSHGKTKVVWNR